MAGNISIVLSESSVNTANNTSVVTANVYYYGNGVSWSSYSCPGTIVLDGTSYSFTNTVSKSTSAQWIGSASKTVTHNADGSKRVSCSASFTVTGTSLGTLSASNSLTLTTIPRATTPTLSAASVALGNEVTINTPRASSAFTHTLTYKMGAATGTIGTGVATSKAWTIPKDLANQISASTSAGAVITCSTYNGSTLIGTKTVNLTVTVPDTEEFRPAIDSVEVTEAVEKISTEFSGTYVQSLSQLNVAITAAGAYGSTIKSYSTALDGLTYNAAQFTSNVINASGIVPVRVTVTDSRGLSAEKTVDVPVADYMPPAITEVAYQQCDPDGNADKAGTATKVVISGKASSVANKNSMILLLKWKRISDTEYKTRTLDVSDWSFTIETVVDDIASDETYEFVAVLADKIMTVEKEVQTGKTVVSYYAGGNGVTLFKEAENAGFWIGNVDYTITGAEYDEIEKLLGEGVFRLVDWIYPVGHIITTANPDYDPNKIFKTHTWVRFAKGQTLVGVDESDTVFAVAEKTGGEKTHKLTSSEMPGHYHLLHDYNNSSNVYTSSKSLASSESTSNPSYATTLTRYSNGYTNPSDTDTYRLRTTIAGNNADHNNLQPYITVYFWKRTA